MSIEAPSFGLELSDGILWVRWGPNTSVNDADAAALVEQAAAVDPEGRAPMLVELNGMVSLTPGALRSFATALNLTAMAIVGPTAVDRTLVGFFTGVHRPPYPARHFEDVDRARKWLTSGTHPTRDS